VYSQTSIEDIIEKKIENKLEQTNETFDETDLYNQLLELSKKPININDKDFTILLNLHLINEYQAVQLSKYINLVDKMESIQELKFIQGFSEKDVDELRLFIIVANKKQKIKPLKWLKQEVSMGCVQPLQKAAAYKRIDDKFFRDSPNKVYLGTNDKLYFRYKIKNSNYFSASLITEKDAGEIFGKSDYSNLIKDINLKQTMGFDYLSANIRISNWGIVKKIIVGDYQLQFGQALTMWSSYAFGKSSETTILKKYARGIIANSSTNENHYLRGVASSVHFKKMELNIFYSNKNRDGNLLSDSTFSNLQLSGLHRTLNEIEDKHTINEQIIGGNLNLRFHKIKLGITYYHQTFNKTMIQSEQIYRKFFFSGNTNYCYGFDYHSIFNRFEFYGELSMSKNKAIAYISAVNYYLNSQAKFHFHYRSYDKSFQNFYANAISESSGNKNEESIYVGINLQLHAKWNLSASVDFFKFPWYKSTLNCPSSGNEEFIELQYTHSPKLSIYGRYKRQLSNVSQKEKDVWFDYNIQKVNESFRLHFNYQLSSKLKLQSRVEWKNIKYQNTYSHGFLLFQEINYESENKKLKCTLRYASFNTDDYDSRIYTYEKDLRYAFSIPAFYGKGNRFYAMINYKIKNKIVFRIKYSQTRYSDCQIIGSGLNLIDGSLKSEIKAELQIRI
jgi:hypothetical protein